MNIEEIQDYQTVLVQGVDDGRSHLNGLFGYTCRDCKNSMATEGYVLVGFDYELTHQCANGLKPEWMVKVDDTLKMFFAQNIARRIIENELPNNRDANWFLKLVMLTYDEWSCVPNWRDDRIVKLHEQMCEYYAYPFKDPYEKSE